jgi:hypothetical protein
MINRASVYAVLHDPDLVGIGSAVVRGRHGSMLLALGRLRDGKDPSRSAELLLDELPRVWTVKASGSSSDQVRKQEAEFLVRRNQTLVNLAGDLEDLGERAVMRAQLVHVTGDPQAILRELGSIGQLTAGSVASLAFKYLDRGRARVVYLEPDGSPAPDDRGSGAFAAAGGLQLKSHPRGSPYARSAPRSGDPRLQAGHRTGSRSGTSPECPRGDAGLHRARRVR